MMMRNCDVDDEELQYYDDDDLSRRWKKGSGSIGLGQGQNLFD